ncbi:MAG: LysE family translocator [Pseudomonadota bacterium]
MEWILPLVVASAVLVAIPGPNVALIVANALRFGFRSGALTVAGTTLGIAVQLALVVFGLTQVLAVLAGALVWIKWLGVAYLVYLGIRTWREAPDDLQVTASASTPGPKRFWLGFGYAIVNPKTLLFNAAFLPQFIGPADPAADLAFVAVIYLAVMAGGDLLWALFADRARPLIGRASRLRNRLSGGLFIGAGLGLAFARVER